MLVPEVVPLVGVGLVAVERPVGEHSTERSAVNSGECAAPKLAKVVNSVETPGVGYGDDAAARAAFALAGVLPAVASVDGFGSPGGSP